MIANFPSNVFQNLLFAARIWLWMENGGHEILISFNVGRRINRGPQYRHGVYYHNDAQKKVAEKVIQAYGEDCVTECLPAAKFYVAEEYHQQYLLKGGQSARKGEDSTIRCYG
jgi:peptide-methionine (S)-S-oxide reductase